MAKKHFGTFLAVTVVAGAAVAGCIAYFSKYRDFQKSLDEDFDDFEEDTEESGTEASSENAETDREENTDKTKESTASPVKREYVSIPLNNTEGSVEHSAVSETSEA